MFAVPNGEGGDLTTDIAADSENVSLYIGVVGADYSSALQIDPTTRDNNYGWAEQE